MQINPKHIESSESKIDLRIRDFAISDVNALQEGQRHQRLVKENIPVCYVATTKSGTPVYRNWLFKHTENERLKAYFGPIFPNLNSNEAIIEGVFTHPEYRGLRIMPNAIYSILNKNEHEHLNRVMAFVKEDNKPSLKAFHLLGFEPFIIREEKWRFFKRTVRFLEIPNTRTSVN